MAAAFIVGGVDVTGPHLFSIYPHGSSDALPFASMGKSQLCLSSYISYLIDNKNIYNAEFSLRLFENSLGIYNRRLYSRCCFNIQKLVTLIHME